MTEVLVEDMCFDKMAKASVALHLQVMGRKHHALVVR